MRDKKTSTKATKKAPAKPGRKGPPSLYTDELADQICGLISEGKTNTEAAREAGIGHSTLHRWIKDNQEMRDKYARACEIRLAMLADKLQELTQQGHVVACDPDSGNTRLQAIKLEIDTIKWTLSKLMPKVYGDRSAVEMTGAEGKPLVPEPVPQGQLAELAGMIASARAKITPDA